MEETSNDRINMIITLANIEEPAESVTINKLIKIPGTALENVQDIDLYDFI